DANEYYGQLALLYQLSEKLSVGPGYRFGSSDVENGEDQTFDRWLLRGDYELTGKTTVSGSIGVEIRDFEGAGAIDEREALVYNFGLDYRLMETVNLLCEVYRRDVSSSLRSNNNFITTGVQATLQVTLLQSLVASLQGLFENADYYNTLVAATADRDDDYFSLKLALDYTSPQDLLGSVFYRFRTNDSTSDAIDFDNNQFGVQLGKEF
ncbi:MAG: hypothetical protein AAF492_05410, partial [Verrucomicrobiota bacterium]